MQATHDFTNTVVPTGNRVLTPLAKPPAASAGPRLANDVSEAVGMVPTVRINHMGGQCKKHDIYMKLESCNPGGSIKEKNAAYLIKKAEHDGLIKPGGTIIESSSGNFGIGLAMVGAARGYYVTIVIDAKTPRPTRRLLEAYGATLVEVPLTEADANGSMQIARMRAAQKLAIEIADAWYPCQHLNPDNPTAHDVLTAREIERAFGGAPDAIVLGISTAGQLAGVGTFFRTFYPRTKIVGVDVAGSAVLGTQPHSYKMTGLGLSFTPPNYQHSMLDYAYSVEDELAFSVCRLLAKREGLLLGGSTGAILAAALSYATQTPEREKILVINPDRGDRYLETIYNDDWLKDQKLRTLSIDEVLETVSNLKPLSETLFRKRGEVPCLTGG